MPSGPKRTTTTKRTTSRTPTIVAIAVVVLVAAVVFGGVLLSGNGSQDAAGAGIPVTPAPAQYTTSVADGVVTAGGPAPHTLDLYEDALCPACQAFEQRDGDRIAQAVAAGRLQVRYHLVNLLEQRSNPPGYSSAAGNAMICAAENNAFPAVHTSLYAAQPSEGGRGYDTGQLVDLGQRAGAGPGYADCVTTGRHVGEVNLNFHNASSDPALLNQGSFGTPTVVLDGRLVQPGSPDLDPVLAG
ncbi:protein-disulfide isomerase [Actinomycetospora succinea]|uniref:Protein-disulfide isomerase n=1 Tax=Actinomycetospora succinea TaxID=663603 RepID=A0A4R6UTC1_9PSEU|nr:thioredoxin domain-containing protein [Actinomycetospora succinea]TDQ48953.1 protein-disulfide isomerase [Actinomycetospora succinea]